MKKYIKEILVCPECLGSLNYYETHGECTECKVNFPVKNGVIFFSEVGNDIVPDGIDYAKNKRSWSAFKKRNYSFLEFEAEMMEQKSIILDIGAGPGFFHELFSRFNQYYTLDFYNYPNIDIVSNIEGKRIPIKSSIADYLILSNVLEHINKPERLLLDCSRILRPDGKLIIIVPFMFKIHQAPYDYCRYTHYKLYEMLDDCGFHRIEIKKMGTIKDVLTGIKYEFNKLLKENTKHRFLLKQFFRLQFHVDNIINKLFLTLDDEQLTNQDVFVGYSCIAIKK